MLNTLIFQWYGEKDESTLHTSWVSIMTENVDQGLIFNSRDIISFSLNQAIKKFVIIDEQNKWIYTCIVTTWTPFVEDKTSQLWIGHGWKAFVLSMFTASNCGKQNIGATMRTYETSSYHLFSLYLHAIQHHACLNVRWTLFEG